MTENSPENDAANDAASDELGAKPEAEITPAEPNPGGVDAMPEGDPDEAVPADLPVHKNPAVDTGSTPELTQGEDTSTKATAAVQPEDEDTEDEDPA